ncbi:hypothetical protein AU156_gp052 [Edwardsiella phage PEi20]|uniref:Uncharacterized protein n=2 Tax=Kanagawavirus pei20 TaxID=2844109 RepID=A0A0B6VP55_9CAUD|nr:hypothetical protein AU156_gp052 [Edwardsiella phage PEi20]BAQ22702.1 conserved hypothetical protein [Edwardsiella phage PEi20]BAQ23003.1 conserved hypothetical protein [Edwardsiella phage PEi26]
MTPEQIVKLNDHYGIGPYETVFDLSEVAQEQYQRDAALLDGHKQGDVITIFIRKPTDEPGMDFMIDKKTIEL